MTTPEQRLWQTVLIQAINDALHDDPYSPENTRAKREAISWLTRGTADFREVCSLAGFDPDHVREAWRCGKLSRVQSKHGNGHEMKARVRDRTKYHRRFGANGMQAAPVPPLPLGV